MGHQREVVEPACGQRLPGARGQILPGVGDGGQAGAVAQAWPFILDFIHFGLPEVYEAAGLRPNSRRFRQALPLWLVVEVVGKQVFQILRREVDALLAIAEVGGHLAVALFLEDQLARRWRLQSPAVLPCRERLN